MFGKANQVRERVTVETASAHYTGVITLELDNRYDRRRLSDMINGRVRDFIPLTDVHRRHLITGDESRHEFLMVHRTLVQAIWPAKEPAQLTSGVPEHSYPPPTRTG